MNYKQIFLLLFVSVLLFGTVCAQRTVNDFEINESYSDVFDGTYYSLYLNDKA